MERVISINGEDKKIVANALLPKKYRHQFGRDLISDMQKMVDNYQNGDGLDDETLSNLTWLMLREGGEDVGDTVDEWLSSINSVFGLYEILPEVVGLWVDNTKTTSHPKKK